MKTYDALDLGLRAMIVVSIFTLLLMVFINLTT